jgi:hypothetical protein
MRKRKSLLAMVALLSSPVMGPMLGLMSCSSTEVHTEKAPDANLAEHDHFAWAPPGQQEQSSELSSRSNTILDQKIKSAVDQDLLKKGYIQNPKEPDIRVAYSLRTHDRLKAVPSSYGPYGGPMWSDGGVGYDTTYLQKEGSLVLDFIDAKSGKLLWRGVAVTDIKDTGVTQKEVQSFVDKIMEKFPSRTMAEG